MPRGNSYLCSASFLLKASGPDWNLEEFWKPMVEPEKAHSPLSVEESMAL